MCSLSFTLSLWPTTQLKRLFFFYNRNSFTWHFASRDLLSLSLLHYYRTEEKRKQKIILFSPPMNHSFTTLDVPCVSENTQFLCNSLLFQMHQSNIYRKSLISSVFILYDRLFLLEYCILLLFIEFRITT